MPSKKVVQFEKFHRDCEFEKLKCNLPISNNFDYTINNLDWLISICLNVTLSVCTSLKRSLASCFLYDLHKGSNYKEVTPIFA